MSRVFIGVGSNQGDRAGLIAQACRLISEGGGIRLVQTGPIIESEAVGGPPQGPYLNTVVELETDVSPEELVTMLQGIERTLGRVRSRTRWAPRPMDLDLLLYDNRVIQTAALIVPHPRLQERRFVLEPLVSIAPHAMHPILRESMAALLARLHEPQPVRR